MSATDLDVAREWVGSEPCDGEVLDAIEIHLGPHRAALAILRARRADMVAAAARWAVSGDYSQDTTANIKALDDHIARLEAVCGEATSALPTLTSAPIVGPTSGR